MTHDEIVDEIVKELQTDVQNQGFCQRFMDTPKDDLSRFHHGMGTTIRNRYNLLGNSLDS